MLDGVAIRGFQNHVNLKFTLDRVTTFVGESDSGKSAVLRAIKWVCLNDPEGDAFVNHGSESCKVGLTFGKKAVSRRRGKKLNEYELNGRKLKPFGVPDAVKKVVNVTGDNFADQLDPHFWLGLKPAEASRQLNAVVNLGLIDSTLANAAKDTHRLKVAVGLARDRYKAAKARRKEMLWAEEFDEKIGNLEKMDATIAQLELKGRRLDQILEGISRASEEVRTRQRGILALQAAVSAEENYRRLSAKADGITEILNKITQLDRLQAKALPDLTELNRLHERYEELDHKGRQLGSILFAIENLDYEIEQCERKIKNLDRKIKAVPGRCPTCGILLAGR